MESWRLVFRDGIVPGLTDAALLALQHGLRHDDHRITQGSTVTPPPLMCVQDWAVSAACCVGYAGWQGEGLYTVREVEEFFARTLFEAETRLGERDASRWFLNWWDDTPRRDAFGELLGEVELALDGRGVAFDGRGPAASPTRPVSRCPF